MPVVSNLDKLAIVIIDSLFQADELRLEKAFLQLNSLEQPIFTTLIDCWRSDTSQDLSSFNKLLSLSETTEFVFPRLILADKASEFNITSHNNLMVTALRFIAKQPLNVEIALTALYQIIKAKGFIADNNLDKAILLLDKLLSDNTNDKLIEGYTLYLLGLSYKLKGKRHYSKAQHYFHQAITIFDLHRPNLYLVNLCRLQLNFFSKISASDASLIAHEFKKIGCLKEYNIALAQYNYLSSKLSNRCLIEDFDNIDRVGKYYFISEPMKESLKRLTTIALADDHVLILGQEGTGKEVFAHTIHQLSNRASKPFVHINCSSLKNELFEAELFGFEKGAFTGADKLKKGLLEEADGGIVFLDEIGELTPNIQPKFLTLLQKGSFRRIGSNSEININIRFIAATNQNLNTMMERDKSSRELEQVNLDATFRSDLVNRFFWKITVPPLNKRREEILYLTQFFLQEFEPNQQFIIDDYTREYLLNRNYPSNIRSLKNFLKCIITCAKEQKSLLITQDLILEAERFMYFDESQHLEQTVKNREKLIH